MTKPLLIAAMGPTASGKSDAALEISRKLNGVVISCDSMQVYRHMPVLTQGTPGVLLTAFLDPKEEYSADQFRKDAEILIQKAWTEKKIPVLTGGTGLYLRALLDGLFESSIGAPVKDSALRKKIIQDLDDNGALRLHERLASVDPVSAKKIHPNDSRRVVRALEIFESTGKPFSEQKSNRSGLRQSTDCRVFVLERDRAELYARIDTRVDRMVEQGLLEEVRSLASRPLSQTAAGALGLKEIGAYLQGKTTLESAVELLKKNTRNYAKRQMSWFRSEKETTKISVSKEDSPEMIAEKILNHCKDAL